MNATDCARRPSRAVNICVNIQNRSTPHTLFSYHLIARSQEEPTKIEKHVRYMAQKRVSAGPCRAPQQLRKWGPFLPSLPSSIAQVEPTSQLRCGLANLFTHSPREKNAGLCPRLPTLCPVPSLPHDAVTILPTNTASCYWLFFLFNPFSNVHFEVRIAYCRTRACLRTAGHLMVH